MEAKKDTGRLDSLSKPLELGIMYCCAEHDDTYQGELKYGILVRYAGIRTSGSPILLDADTFEEAYPDYDVLVRQIGTAIDIDEAIASAA